MKGVLEMAIVEASIVPLRTESTSLSQYVADCHKVLKKGDINYQLTPMGTILEGDLNKIMEIIAEMHKVPFSNGAQRVSTSIKIDDRRDKVSTMIGKVEAVKEKL